MGINFYFKVDKCQTQWFSLTSQLVASQQVESQWSCTLIRFQALPRTSDAFAPERKELVNLESHFISKVPHSIVSSLNSWLKVEISQLVMEHEVNQSMVRNSQMKTSFTSIQKEETSQWPTLDQTQMDLSSSCVSSHAIGLMESMLFSDKLLMDGRLWITWSQLVQEADKPKLHVSLLTADNSNEINEVKQIRSKTKVQV